MIDCIPEVLTLLMTPILTYVCMPNAWCHRCQKCHICHIWHIWHVWCSDIHHMYVCQYGCQKKRKDLRNAANHLRYPTKMYLWPKIEISYFLIFPLYFSEFPLYTLGGLRSVASHGKELFPVIFSSSMPQYLQEIENLFISDFWLIMGHPSIMYMNPNSFGEGAGGVWLWFLLLSWHLYCKVL